MSYRIGQLILTPASKNNTISEVFVAQPDSDKEALAGKIFILLEIETKRSDGLKLANFLINYINNSYYQNEKLVLKEKIPSLRIEHIFESVVSRANKKIFEFIKEENIKISPNSLNSTIGLIYNNEIHFSTAGKNRALLIYKKIQDNTSSYKTIDLNKNDSPEQSDSKNKLFTNVISGTIPEGSSFIFSNEALPEYLSPKQLSEISTTLPPTSAVEQIKNTLSQINEYISFIGIIIKSSQLNLDENKSSLERPIQMQDSANKLNDTEQVTENILSPSGNVKIKSYLKNFNYLVSKLIPKNKGKDTLFLQAGSKINSRALKFYSNKLFTFIKSLLVNIANFLFFIFKSLGNIKKLKGSITFLETLFSNVFLTGKKTFVSFKGKYKIITIIFVISILGLSYGINKVKKEKIAEEERIQYETIVEDIEQRQNQAEANLLYNNEDSAKELFIEIKDLLAKLSQDTDEQIVTYDSFSEKLNDQLDKVRKVVEISDNKPLIDFSDINKNSKVQKLVLSSGNIYASDTDQNSIYIYNLDSKLTTTITDLNKKLENINYPVASDDKTIFWFNNDSIIKLNTKTEEIFDIDLVKNPNGNISAMSTYNQRTYVLDNKASQIYRYEKGDTGFLNFSQWLNTETDLTKAISLDIDGNIFTLDNDGTIRKFLKGDEENFVQDLVEPPIESANKIIVSKDNNFIYVLESSKSRIVIYEKDGRFVEQLLSKNLENISDFIVDENNKISYIVSDNKIYSINLSNLD
ncbi:MAG: hypothetical protein PF572_06395 [Patescibacteria group bacterium]|jgi:sugar lactone lactonase YvrE|nr:hypothetical protein [Patescibacteria group bacterium]